MKEFRKLTVVIFAFFSEEEVGSVFKTNDEAVTYKVPQASVKAETDSN